MESKWLERVGIAEAAKRRIAGYSGGMKQRLGLAQALIHRPKLLILDSRIRAGPHRQTGGDVACCGISGRDNYSILNACAS